MVNVWQHKKTNEVLIQYKIGTFDKRNHYLEAHSHLEKVESRLKKVKDIITQSEDVETGLDKVTVTKGQIISGRKSSKPTLEDAFDYMAKK